LCIAFCPQQVFSEDEDHHPVVAYPERCVACQWCTMHCPDFAIVVEAIKSPEDGVAK
jgi:2-oxoglutarate ferredoxin oxidoreductase subunit delta